MVGETEGLFFCGLECFNYWWVGSYGVEHEVLLRAR